MENDNIYPGMMVYSHNRQDVGWIVGEYRVGKSLVSNGYTLYRVEWAKPCNRDYLSIQEVFSYHRNFLDLANGK